MNNIARGVLTLILCFVLVGFGVCGAFGTFGGIASLFDHSSGDSAVAPMLIGLGPVGLAIAWGCWKAVASLWRKRPPGGA
jgi:hypothetical protein